MINFLGAYLFLRRFLLKDLVAFVLKRRRTVQELKQSCAALESKEAKLQLQKEALLKEFQVSMSEQHKVSVPDEAAVVPPLITADSVELPADFTEKLTASLVEKMRKECRRGD
jgi:hypothetical protein